jgi:L-ascorbate metabolism protein UlaG (beta-lactamase superfamily)
MLREIGGQSQPSSAPPAAVTWLGHATVLLELDGVRVLTDPVLGKRVGPLVRISPQVDAAMLGRVDRVLLSHLHADHTDIPSLRRLGGSTPVIVPEAAAGWLRRKGMCDVRGIRAGQELAVGELRVLAAPAVHEGRRRPMGVAAEPVGYVVRGSRSVYFAGDTDLFAQMRDLRGEIDVALLPVWGWGPSVGAGHLDPERAARAAALMAPAIAIPIHWGTLALPRPLGRSDDPERPAREFAVLAARHVPEVEVRVLGVGERTEV